MIVTEEEAKTKRCQEGFGPGMQSPDGEVQMAYPSHGSYGYVIQASPSRCIGSACMAWRWAIISEAHTYSFNIPRSTTHGYCGKAGQP